MYLFIPPSVEHLIGEGRDPSFTILREKNGAFFLGLTFSEEPDRMYLCKRVPDRPAEEAEGRRIGGAFVSAYKRAAAKRAEEGEAEKEEALPEGPEPREKTFAHATPAPPDDDAREPAEGPKAGDPLYKEDGTLTTFTTTTPGIRPSHAVEGHVTYLRQTSAEGRPLVLERLYTEPPEEAA